MVVIGTDSLSVANVAPAVSSSAETRFARWGRGQFLLGDLGNINTTTIITGSGGTALVPVFRGKIGATYVYSTGTPPGGGATDIVIIDYV